MAVRAGRLCPRVSFCASAVRRRDRTTNPTRTGDVMRNELRRYWRIEARVQAARELYVRRYFYERRG